VVHEVLKSKLPTVAFGSGYGWYDPKLCIPYFFTDNRKVSRLAARHLLDRGFHHFAFYGGVPTRTNGWSLEREREFTEYLGESGHRCQIYRDRRRTARNWASYQRKLGAWLLSLPKPVGLMAENDQRARLVLDACRTAELRVPEDVAVIGVDNHELLCQLTTPLLSSIEQGSMRIGYEAAMLLDQIMSGNTASPTSVIVPPVGVVWRQSTDVFATDDPKVAKAMRFISDHACEGIQAQDVADAMAVSRSGLDAHFKSALGRTISAAIRDVQLDRVMRLVSDTTLSLKEIAHKTGFRSVQHMTTRFTKAFGHPPAKHRRLVFRQTLQFHDVTAGKNAYCRALQPFPEQPSDS